MIENILLKKDIIHNQIEKLSKKIEKNNWRNTASLIRKLAMNMEQTIGQFNKTSLSKLGQAHAIKDAESQMDRTLFNFQMMSQALTDNDGNELSKIDKSKLSALLKNLLHLYNLYFSAVVTLFLNQSIIRLSPAHGRSKATAETTSFLLSQLFDLSLKSEYIKKALIREQFILLLLELLKDSALRGVLDLILRLLSILINDFDSLPSLQRIDVISLLTDILCDEKLQEWTRTECAGCIGKMFY